MIVSAEKALEIKRNEVMEWDGNPREMWVWDDDLGVRSVEKMFVVYINPDKAMNKPVITDRGARYDHCAEIEEELMTHKELSRWLRLRPDREYKIIVDNISGHVGHEWTYREDMADDPAYDNITVREGDGEWVKPTRSLLDDD